jgi:hypothetical protein
MENTSRSHTAHRWYTRPVSFVADVQRAARSYVDLLGFEKGWHAGAALERSVSLITVSARSSSVKTQPAATEGACSSS